MMQHHRVLIVDDDVSVREALSWLLRTRRLLSDSYGSAESFLTDPCWQHMPNDATCLLLDVRMPGMSGLTVFERLQTLPWANVIPVIFLSGHADVAMAVDAVKRGAFDFCEKPFSNNVLVDRIVQALTQSATVLSQHQAQQGWQRQLNDLTEREQAVMQLVIDGLPNKLVADRLGISVRTVEVHRARVFDKLNVKSAVELANLFNKYKKPT